MRAGGVQEADAVVLGLPVKAAYPFSDAQLLSALFLVQELAAEAERRVHVVAKVTHANSKTIAQKFIKQLSNLTHITYELLLPEQITSAVLTQVGKRHMNCRNCNFLPFRRHLYRRLGSHSSCSWFRSCSSTARAWSYTS